MNTPLRRARKAARLTQGQLADAVGIKQASLSEMERGDIRPSPQVAERLATRLAISEMELLYPERYTEQ